MTNVSKSIRSPATVSILEHYQKTRTFSNTVQRTSSRVNLTLNNVRHELQGLGADTVELAGQPINGPLDKGP